jgi:hypothetical protein
VVVDHARQRFAQRLEEAHHASRNDPRRRRPAPVGPPRQGREWSCASCHTENPAAVGIHAKTGRPIQALAPAANGDRFTRAEKVEKWFRRNCNDVLGRSCTAAEKGDVLAYLMTVRQ